MRSALSGRELKNLPKDKGRMNVVAPALAALLGLLLLCGVFIPFREEDESDEAHYRFW